MEDADDRYRVRPVEWDENKRRANVAKHGIDFAAALAVFNDLRSRVYGPRAGHGKRDSSLSEWRQAGVIAVVFTERNESIRIISARVARRSERRLYEQA